MKHTKKSYKNFILIIAIMIGLASTQGQASWWGGSDSDFFKTLAVGAGTMAMLYGGYKYLTRDKSAPSNPLTWYKLCNLSQDNNMYCETIYDKRFTLTDTNKTFAELWQDLKNKNILQHLSSTDLQYVLWRLPQSQIYLDGNSFNTIQNDPNIKIYSVNTKIKDAIEQNKNMANYWYQDVLPFYLVTSTQKRQIQIAPVSQADLPQELQEEQKNISQENPIITYAKVGNLTELKKLINQTTDPTTLKEALKTAIKNNHKECVGYLIQNRAITKQPERYTEDKIHLSTLAIALKLATSLGNQEIFTRILTEGINYLIANNSINPKTPEGQRTIYRIKTSGINYTEKIKTLLSNLVTNLRTIPLESQIKFLHYIVSEQEDIAVTELDTITSFATTIYNNINEVFRSNPTALNENETLIEAKELLTQIERKQSPGTLIEPSNGSLFAMMLYYFDLINQTEEHIESTTNVSVHKKIHHYETLYAYKVQALLEDIVNGLNSISLENQIKFFSYIVFNQQDLALVMLDTDIPCAEAILKNIQNNAPLIDNNDPILQKAIQQLEVLNREFKNNTIIQHSHDSLFELAQYYFALIAEYNKVMTPKIPESLEKFYEQFAPSAPPVEPMSLEFPINLSQQPSPLLESSIPPSTPTKSQNLEFPMTISQQPNLTFADATKAAKLTQTAQTISLEEQKNYAAFVTDAQALIKDMNGMLPKDVRDRLELLIDQTKFASAPDSLLEKINTYIESANHILNQTQKLEADRLASFTNALESINMTTFTDIKTQVDRTLRSIRAYLKNYQPESAMHTTLDNRLANVVTKYAEFLDAVISQLYNKQELFTADWASAIEQAFAIDITPVKDPLKDLISPEALQEFENLKEKLINKDLQT